MLFLGRFNSAFLIFIIWLEKMNLLTVLNASKLTSLMKSNRVRKYEIKVFNYFELKYQCLTSFFWNFLVTLIIYFFKLVFFSSC